MCLLNDRDYYLTRVETCRDLAARATDPHLAKLHTEFAANYERTLSTMIPEPPIIGSGVAQVV